jgi:purine-nucleoside phosphorylase
MVVADHLNMTGLSPLSGPAFVDMVDAYSPELRALAHSTSAVPDLASGTYAQVLGPQFETPAEIQMLRTLGADVVGMSMALETIAARHAGADVLGLAVVTNEAAGVTPGATGIDGVAAAGAAAVPSLAEIIRHVVVSLP